MKRKLLLLALAGVIAGVIAWSVQPSAVADPDLASRVAELTIAQQDQARVVIDLRDRVGVLEGRIECLSGAAPVTQYTDSGRTFLDASRRPKAKHLWVVVWQPGCADEHLMRSGKNRAWSW